MELKEVVKNLSIKSDVCLLDAKQLIDKYCCDEESYKNFLEVFSRVFSNRKLYPILTSFKYRDVEEVIKYGQKYLSDDTEEYEVEILREIYKNEHQTELDIRGDDYGQAISLFNEGIGAHKVKDSTSCGLKMCKMSECGKIYEESDKQISQEEFKEFVNSIYLSEELGRYPHRFETILKEYLDNNPKMKLCYNNDFLYLANYLINSHSECCDQEFLDFTKNVVGISTEASSIVPESFSRKNYMKLAKFTLQNIDKLEKKRNNLVVPKKKILDFLKK